MLPLARQNPEATPPSIAAYSRSSTGPLSGSVDLPAERDGGLRCEFYNLHLNNNFEPESGGWQTLSSLSLLVMPSAAYTYT